MSIKALDKLGEAIVDAGYDWTYDMRKAYEDGIKQSQWKDLTNEELAECWDTVPERAMRRVMAKLKEKNT